jgi:hypothetical protein
MGIFLLAAVSRGGLDTLYALQNGAGLQPGSIAPVIRALIEARLLQRSDRKKRRRKPMMVTNTGEEVLLDEWKNSLNVGLEVESILRGTTVALLMGDSATACQYLLGAAQARAMGLGPAVFDVTALLPTPTALHTRMRDHYQMRRRAMEAEFFNQLASFLGENCQKSEARGVRAEL